MTASSRFITVDATTVAAASSAASIPGAGFDAPTAISAAAAPRSRRKRASSSRYSDSSAARS